MSKSPNPQDATKGVAARARNRAIAKALKPRDRRLMKIEKRVAAIERAMRHGTRG